MKRHIYIRDGNARHTINPRLVKLAVCTALEAEGVRCPCEISVLITDDEGIRAINSEHRGLDKSTDVLSFPCFDFTPGGFDVRDGKADAATGCLPLGDIVLSAERIEAQAGEYGNTLRRETVYLVIHSVLHLLGYDHVDEGADKRKMREREEQILKLCGYGDKK